MLTMLLVVVIVSAALLLGAAWGLFGKLPKGLEGFLIALAGGALIVSAMEELIRPSIETSGLLPALGLVSAGAVVFTIADTLVDEVWGSDSGGGLLAAITLDGVPENLALGVALIGAGPMAVAALAGSIFLSNLPEAAGGAKSMTDNGRSKGQAFALWAGTAALLAGAAVAGNLLLAGASDAALGLIRCFAAGAVVASLATEVFPKAYREDSYLAGIATAFGLVVAAALSHLGGGGG
ncbi:ZIP family metal transporter [Parvularcula dongshanensis]|uniref:ZIP family zinc transporter n=1 Tax=Parvularcula dongshanensis TaxID=1173995 RepID=A0A840I501_9PROT|nr:zinc transporter [Parvularcula dongshanensis]MBB4660036.1 ZIP family zinc transporter [Parvularcula dongshanensis]